jgi:hypothetical protein
MSVAKFVVVVVIDIYQKTLQFIGPFQDALNGIFNPRICCNKLIIYTSHSFKVPF